MVKRIRIIGLMGIILAVMLIGTTIFPSILPARVYADSSPTPTVVSTIPLLGIYGGYLPYGVAVNSTHNLIYVANRNSNNVSVINGSINSLVAAVNVGSSPSSVAVNPSTNQIYVANNMSNNVSVIDGSTNSVTATLNVGTWPCAVAVNPSTNLIYVANNDSDTVSVIDGSTNSLTATVNMGSSPISVAVNSITNLIYVANSPSTVSVINGSTNSVIATMNVGSLPCAVAVNPSTNLIYVVNNGSNTLSVIDGSTNSVTATVNVGAYPRGVGVNPTTNQIYVANYGSDTVSVIDGSTNIVTATVNVGSVPCAVGVNPSTNLIYVANGQYSTISVIQDVTPISNKLTSSANPSAFGQPVTFTATLNPIPDNGTIQFQDNGINTGSPVALNASGQVTWITSSLLVGTHTINALYSGDTIYAPCTGSLTQMVSQTLTSTNIGLVSSVNPSVSGQSVTFIATVNPIPDSGTIQFQDNGINLGNAVNLDGSGQATYSISTLLVGSHTITAVYSGNSNFASSSASFTQTVGKATTTTAVTSSANPSTSGQSVTFTATVTPIPDGGTIQFQDNDASLGSPMILNSLGQAYIISNVSIGTHTITAIYSGNTNFVSSAGTLIQTIIPIWDINGDHVCNVLDLITIGNHIGETY